MKSAPVKEHLRELVAQSLLDLRRQGRLPQDLPTPDYVIERSKSREHGDYATNIALLLAKPAGMKPRELAEALVANMGDTQHVSKVEIAGPGFINFRISQPCRLATVRRVFELGADYGRQPADSRESVTVEFVSANPNGPLHVGHGRGAAYGASVANLLEAAGHKVQREYYVNDAGRQMDILAVSVWLRYHELSGVTVRFPDNGYKGEYVSEIARALRAKEGDRLRRTAIEISDGLPADEGEGGDKELHVDALIARARQLLGAEDYRVVFDAGLAWCLADIRNDLIGFGVVHDNFFSERSLATDGYMARLKAAAQGLGLDPARIEIQLVQFAILYRGSERVQMSTRAGSFVTLRELREEVGTDAARFFYVMRGNDQHLDFDLELAKSHSNDNPVYYIQYAHARIASLFRQLKDKGLAYNDGAAVSARKLLTTEAEDILLVELMRFPEMIEAAANGRAPQVMAHHLRDVAAAFHGFYNACPILSVEEELRQARLGLCKATQQVLANGLALLGVSAPESM